MNEYGKDSPCLLLSLDDCVVEGERRRVVGVETRGWVQLEASYAKVGAASHLVDAVAHEGVHAGERENPAPLVAGGLGDHPIVQVQADGHHEPWPQVNRERTDPVLGYPEFGFGSVERFDQLRRVDINWDVAT